MQTSGRAGKKLAPGVMALALFVAMASPADAFTNSGTLVIQSTDPGRHEHVGVPYQSTPPCAHYVTHTYNAETSGGSGFTIGGTTFTDAEVHVEMNNTAGYDAGPGGTYAPNPLGGCSGSPVAISGFILEIEGKNGTDKLTCEGTGTFYRDSSQTRTFEFLNARCRKNADPWESGNIVFSVNPASGLGANFNGCSAPIAPTVCYTSGNISFT